VTEEHHLIAISAAWEVWGEHQHAVRRLVRSAEWSGDLPDAAQLRDAQNQVRAQMREAYSRTRVQCAIVAGVDGVDCVPMFAAHWIETWGDTISSEIAREWAEANAVALERQHAARTKARAVAASFAAAGVTTDLD
jgi:hypothetical protein